MPGPARLDSTMFRVMSILRRLRRDSRAQDLLEYAMLTALVAIIGVAVWALIEARLGQAYATYDADTQGLWAPPDPIAPPPTP